MREPKCDRRSTWQIHNGIDHALVVSTAAGFEVRVQTPEGLQLIKRLPAEIEFDGSVKYSFRTVGEYGCDMDTNLRNYPYDVHTCSLDVTVAESESEIDIQDGDILGTIAGCEGWDGA